MVDYSKARIYQIISPNYPLPYIGSTTQPLSKRFTKHRHGSNTCSSRIVIDAGDAYIELIEEFRCDNREQLNKREGEVIRERECVNRKVAGRTPVEYKMYYRKEKCESISVYDKQYREANKERLAQCRRERIRLRKSRDNDLHNHTLDTATGQTARRGGKAQPEAGNED